MLCCEKLERRFALCGFGQTIGRSPESVTFTMYKKLPDGSVEETVIKYNNLVKMPSILLEPSQTVNNQLPSNLSLNKPIESAKNPVLNNDVLKKSFTNVIKNINKSYFKTNNLQYFAKLK